ncbi:MAG: hypothetical protein ACRELF_26540, partial [Gemmataceae bacterium]
ENTARERDQLRGEYDNLGRTLTGLLSKADEAASNAGQPPAQSDLVGELVKRLSPADETDKLFSDPLFGKGFQRFRGELDDAYNSRFGDVTKRLDDLGSQFKTAVEALSNSQIYEREQRWYHDNRSDIPEGQDGKRLSLDAVKDYAQHGNFFIPNTRLIDFDRALDSLTTPARQRAELDRVKQEAYQQGLQAGRTGKAQVLPLFGDRSGGGTLATEYNTKGKSSRQMINERVGQGLADLANEQAAG